MRVLVTGGAGYIGSVLVPRLLELGHTVTALDNLRYGGHGLLPCFRDPAFRFVQGDVRDGPTVRRELAQHDAVIHLAAIVGVPACRKYPAEAESVNVEGTRVVVEALGRDQALVFASTGSFYGDCGAECSEDSPLNPGSLYSDTKMRAERLALDAGNAVSLRLATGFGVSPRFRLDLLVNDFVRQAVVNRQLIVYEKDFRRTFLHVQDIARAFAFAIERLDRMRGRAFNVGHESLNLTKEQVALAIRERVDFYLHFAEVGHDPDRRDYSVSFQRSRDLGFESTVTLGQGLDELIRAMAVLRFDSPYDNL